MKLRADKISKHSREVSRKVNRVVTAYAKQEQDQQANLERCYGAFIALAAELEELRIGLQARGVTDAAIEEALQLGKKAVHDHLKPQPPIGG